MQALNTKEREHVPCVLTFLRCQGFSSPPDSKVPCGV
jgi:hypothetical protein